MFLIVTFFQISILIQIIAQFLAEPKGVNVNRMFIIMISATHSFHNVVVVAQVASQDVLQNDHTIDMVPLQ